MGEELAQGWSQKEEWIEDKVAGITAGIVVEEEWEIDGEEVVYLVEEESILAVVVGADRGDSASLENVQPRFECEDVR